MTVAKLIEQLMECDLDEEICIAYSQQEPYDDVIYGGIEVLAPEGGAIVLTSLRDFETVWHDLKHRR